MKRRWFWGGLVMAVLFFSAAADRAAEQDAAVARGIQTTEKVVALTIDAGPHPIATPKMLASLGAAGIKATFFLLGSHAEAEPDLVRAEQAAGHEIALHGYAHKNMARLSPQEIAADWEAGEAALAKLGITAKLFRPPGGAYGAALTEAAAARGSRLVLWNVDPRDWENAPAEEVTRRVLAEVRPGSIILLHDGQHPIASPEAVKRIAAKLKADGYRFVTVSELLSLE